MITSISRVLTIFAILFLVVLGYIVDAGAHGLCSAAFNDPEVETQRVHEQITRDLYNGEILSLTKWGKIGFMFEMRATDPLTGEVRILKGYFKPRLWGDRNTFHPMPYAGNAKAGRTPMEYVAYHLNRLLEMDYIAPTAYRRGLNYFIDGEHLTEGSFSFFVPELKDHQQSISPVAAQDHQLLNHLLENPDGNDFNAGTGVHWVTGETADVFWDFSAGFGQMGGMWGGPKTATISSEKVRNALQRLKFEVFKGDIEAGFITPEEVNRILDKVAKLLAK